MAELVLSDVCVRRGGRAILDGVSLRVRPGELVALLGANGAGKTTLLRLAAGAARADNGVVRLDDGDPAALAPLVRARRLAYLPQTRPLAWPIRIRDLVQLGRFAHGAQRAGPDDDAAVARALSACGLTGIAERRADEVSGGELARAHIARALAAEAGALIADEPAAGLDPGHAWRVLEVLRARARAGAAVLVSLHEPALAARFADRVALLAGGRLIADDAPAAALTPALMAAAYGVVVGMPAVGLDVQGLAG